MTKTNSEIVEAADESVVETKITKSEAVELLIGELQTEVNKEYNAAQAQKTAAEAAFKAITFDDVADLLKHGEVSVHTWGRSDKEVRIEIKMETKRGDRRIPAVVKRAIEENEAAEKALDLVRTKRHELFENRTRLKNEMLRTILEATSAGRKFLGQLSELRVKIERRRLLAGSDSR